MDVVIQTVILVSVGCLVPSVFLQVLTFFSFWSRLTSSVCYNAIGSFFLYLVSF